MGLDQQQRDILNQLTAAGFNVHPGVMHLLDELSQAEIDCIISLVTNGGKGPKVVTKAAIFDGVGAHTW